MFRSKVILGFYFFSFLFFCGSFPFVRVAHGEEPNVLRGDPWVLVERETFQLLKRYSPEVSSLESASLEKQARFYIDAGLWSTAERLLLSAPGKEGKGFLLEFYARRGDYRSVYSAYKREPGLFQNQPELLMGASHGALIEKAYPEALTLLKAIPPSGRLAPYRFYLSALAYWGLRDKAHFNEVLEEGARWGAEHPESPWAARLDLLTGYYHLSLKEYDAAFERLGRLFNQNAFIDLAFLGLGWGYFEMSSLENLLSALQGFQEGQGESPYYIRFIEILTQFQMKQGDLPRAIETDERERGRLREKIEALEIKIRQIQKGEIAIPISAAPGALLKKTLLGLEEQAGAKKEVGALLRKIDLWQRERALASLREWERLLRKEEERLQARVVRRCLTMGGGAAVSNQRGEGRPLYLEAREAARRGKSDEVERHLKKLLDQAPQGPYAEEVSFRLGDLAFERGDFSAAISYYRLLLDRPKAYLYRWALYKSAWAHYLQGNPEKAIPLLFQQRDLLKQEGEGTGACEGTQDPQELQDGLRLLALLLQAEGGADRLTRWVAEKSPSENFQLFSELAQYYESTGRRKERVQLLQSWDAAHPLYAETPFLHQAMIETYARLDQGTTPDALQARIAFVENYRPGSLWAKNNSAESGKKVVPFLKKHLRFLMSHFSLEAKKAGRVALYQKTLSWYQLYLELFPAEDETGEVRFLYAELLDMVKDEQRAAAAYRASAYQDAPHKFSAEAGYREVVILEKSRPSSDPNLWEGYARFIQGFPSDPRVAQIYLKQAEIAFQEGDYDKSRQFAEAIKFEKRVEDCPVSADPSGPSRKSCAEKAALQEGMKWAARRLIAQGYIKGKEYSRAIDLLQERLSQIAPEESGADAAPSSQISKGASGELQEIRSLLTISYYQQGEALKRAGNGVDAAAAYWEAYQKGPETDLGPLALFEAASLWGSASEREKSEEALSAFRRRYPQSALYHPVLIRLGTLYTESNRFSEAAETYEEAGRLKVDPALASQAMEEAINLYQKMEKWEKVYRLAMQMVERSQGGKQIERPGAERLIKGIVIGAEAKFKLGETKVAQKMLTDLLRTAKQKGAPKKGSGMESEAFYLAKAGLLLAESEMKQFGEIKLVAPLERNLQRKKALFDRLLQEYGPAAEAPSPILALAATHRIGELFEEFSGALLRSERPRELSPEEKEEYERLLKEQALPYLQKAEGAYQRNIDWGVKAGVERPGAERTIERPEAERTIENEWVKKSAERLRQIQQQMESFQRNREAPQGGSNG